MTKKNLKYNRPGVHPINPGNRMACLAGSGANDGLWTCSGGTGVQSSACNVGAVAIADMKISMGGVVNMCANGTIALCHTNSGGTICQMGTHAFASANAKNRCVDGAGPGQT